MKPLLSALFIIGSTAIVSIPKLPVAEAQFGAESPGNFGYRPLHRRIPETTPTLLIESKHFFVHDFNGNAQKTQRPYGRVSNPIIYTSRDTGKMHTLYASGDFPTRTSAGGVEQQRILGLTTDNKNLYLCVWEAPPFRAETPKNHSAIDGGLLYLLVFRASDGQFTQEYPVLPDGDMSKFVSEDNLGTGPLRVEKNAIICFDQTFKFIKGQLVPPKTIKAPDIPISGFGQGDLNPSDKGGFIGGDFGF
ncbi:hypothetical protein IAD21_04009 [Abditibacteriota bacterium]|nr:hypothetical protein IAD21_04009 [Abditibacteriota bacterium]